MSVRVDLTPTTGARDPVAAARHGRPERRRRRRVAALATVLAAVLTPVALVVGCNGSGHDDTGHDGTGARGAEAGDDGAEMFAPDASESGAAAVAGEAGPDTAGPALSVQSGRMQTFDATLRLGVEQLEDALSSARSEIEASGGFVASEDIDLGDSSRATVIYRVPADGFRTAIDGLAALGDLREQDVGAQDVTAQYADLEGRATTMRTSITRLQGFLAEAGDVNQIALLEGELTRREAEFESVESQRRALSDEVELSSITVHFEAAGTATEVDDARALPSFLGGLGTGWDAAVAAGSVVLAGLGFALPFLPLVAVGLLAVVVRSRRRAGPQPG